MPDEVIQKLVEAGLLFRVSGLSARELQKLYQLIEMLHYSRVETADKPDANLEWLRDYRAN